MSRPSCIRVSEERYPAGVPGCRELLEITEKLIDDMPTELPGTVREGATALQLLKGAKNEEVSTVGRQAQSGGRF